MSIQKMITATWTGGLTLLSIVPGSAFPAMLFERTLPLLPVAERFTKDMEGRSWYHFLKNVWTELIRADAQWWGKFLAFLILTYSLKSLYNLIRKN